MRLENEEFTGDIYRRLIDTVIEIRQERDDMGNRLAKYEQAAINAVQRKIDPPISVTPVGACSPEPVGECNPCDGKVPNANYIQQEIRRDMGIFKKALYDIQRALRKEEDAHTCCDRVGDIVEKALKDAGFEP